MGASVAYHLARLGVTDVIVLEREKMLATGSTGRNAGGVRHQFSNEANIRLSLESIALLGFLVAVLLAGTAYAQSCTGNVPHVHGTWETLPYLMLFDPISANLLPNGKVLIVAAEQLQAQQIVPWNKSLDLVEHSERIEG